MSDTKHVDTMDLRAALAGGGHEMDAYLELRNGEQIIAEIKALVETGTGERSLRDYFAGQALTGLCSEVEAMTVLSVGAPAALSEAAYELADSMLKAREK